MVLFWWVFLFWLLLLVLFGFLFVFSYWLPIVIKIRSKSAWQLRPMHFISRKMLRIYTIMWTILGIGSETRKYYNHWLGLPLACWILHLCLCSSFIKSLPIQLGCCEKWDLPSSTCLKEGHHGSHGFCYPCLSSIFLDKALPGVRWSSVTLLILFQSHETFSRI